MMGTHLVLIGIAVLIASAPSILTGYWDLIELHARTGPELVQTLDCAQHLATERAGMTSP